MKENNTLETIALMEKKLCFTKEMESGEKVKQAEEFNTYMSEGSKEEILLHYFGRKNHIKYNMKLNDDNIGQVLSIDELTNLIEKCKFFKIRKQKNIVKIELEGVENENI